jgi:hypothetical protein
MRLRHPLALLILLLPAFVAPAALAAPAETLTQTFHNAIEVDPDNVHPCTGDEGTLTTVENGVIHVTMTANGGFHLTGTFTGTLEFVPDDPAKPSFTGHLTLWFGDNDNLRNEADTVTFTVHAEGSDSSSLDIHDTMHLSVSATGLAVSFDKPRCG